MAGIQFDDLAGEFKWYSEALSKSVRTTGFGIIAAIWAIFTADGISLEAAGAFGLRSSLLVTLAFVFSGAALGADIMQYVSAYWMTSIGLDRWEAAENKGAQVEFYYNRDNLGCFGLALYRVSFILLVVKLACSVLGAASFFLLAFAVTVSA